MFAVELIFVVLHLRLLGTYCVEALVVIIGIAMKIVDIFLVTFQAHVDAVKQIKKSIAVLMSKILRIIVNFP